VSTSFPKHAYEHYGPTSFATNEITSDIEDMLLPTDTRYRPDLRAMEERNIVLAETEKARLDAVQQERKRRGAEAAPKWFRKIGPKEYVYSTGSSAPSVGQEMTRKA
jgi:oxysterol-binding protein-related protein 3/6/7